MYAYQIEPLDDGMFLVTIYYGPDMEMVSRKAVNSFEEALTEQRAHYQASNSQYN